MSTPDTPSPPDPRADLAQQLQQELAALEAEKRHIDPMAQPDLYRETTAVIGVIRGRLLRLQNQARTREGA